MCCHAFAVSRFTRKLKEFHSGFKSVDRAQVPDAYKVAFIRALKLGKDLAGPAETQRRDWRDWFTALPTRLLTG